MCDSFTSGASCYDKCRCVGCKNLEGSEARDNAIHTARKRRRRALKNRKSHQVLKRPKQEMQRAMDHATEFDVEAEMEHGISVNGGKQEQDLMSPTSHCVVKDENEESQLCAHLDGQHASSDSAGSSAEFDDLFLSQRFNEPAIGTGVERALFGPGVEQAGTFLGNQSPQLGNQAKVGVLSYLNNDEIYHQSIVSKDWSDLATDELVWGWDAQGEAETTQLLLGNKSSNGATGVLLGTRAEGSLDEKDSGPAEQSISA
jgi:hypothetical protein